MAEEDLPRARVAPSGEADGTELRVAAEEGREMSAVAGGCAVVGAVAAIGAVAAPSSAAPACILFYQRLISPSLLFYQTVRKFYSFAHVQLGEEASAVTGGCAAVGAVAAPSSAAPARVCSLKV